MTYYLKFTNHMYTLS